MKGLTVAPAIPAFLSIQQLIRLRWLALCGQSLTIVGLWCFEFQMPYQLMVLIIGLSSITNIILWRSRHDQQLIYQEEARFFLLYDVGQLTVLLFLSGGVLNPFCVLLVAPTAVAVTILRTRDRQWVLGCAMLCLVFLAGSPYPVPTTHTPILPAYFLENMLKVGMLVALCITIVFMALYLSHVQMVGKKMRQAVEKMTHDLKEVRHHQAALAVCAAVTHELGSPLTTLRLISEDFLHHPQDITTTDIEELVMQVRRCHQIVQDFSRQVQEEEPSFFVQLPLRAFLQMQVEAVLNDRETDMTFDIQCLDTHPTEEPMIRLYPEMIYLFKNIFTNAFDFARTHVLINVSWEESTLTVQVQDDGPGVSEEVLCALGLPFISQRDGHLGLGLFVIQHLVTTLGGQWHIVNKIEGACVTVHLPYERTER